MSLWTADFHTAGKGSMYLWNNGTQLRKQSWIFPNVQGWFLIILATKRRIITGPRKHRAGKFASVLLSFLEQSRSVMPATTTLKSDLCTFQLPAAQSILSVGWKAWDSCWLLRSAFSVTLTHSPCPCSHTEKERQAGQDYLCSDSYKRLQSPGFGAADPAMFGPRSAHAQHIYRPQ